MKKDHKRLVGVLSALLAIGGGHAVTAQAQQTAAAQAEPVTSEDVVITGEITYRDRADSTAPVLEYGLDYFQKFEPLTVGDMLKRVPSTAFVSDVLEYDGVQLRGLDPGYTQILINGEKVPGNGADRSFFVDRIPAELVERVEIVRSASANRSGDAIAGALNIVLRDAVSLDGGYLRAGGLHYDDGEIKPTLGVVWGGEIGPGRALLGANVQGRHNPKEKRSIRYDDAGDFDDREDQSDVRDGTDYSVNGSYEMPWGQTGKLTVSALGVKTDREEIENSREYDSETGTGDANLKAVVPGFAYIEQNNWAVDAAYKNDAGFKLKAGYSKFEESSSEGETAIEFDTDDYNGGNPAPTNILIPQAGTSLAFDEWSLESEALELTDEEYFAKAAQEFSFGGATKLEVGVDFRRKERATSLIVSESEDYTADELGGGPFVQPAIESEFAVGGLSTIEEWRADPYLMFSGAQGPVKWEAGLRYETTDVEIVNLDEDERATNDYEFLLPSGHVQWNLSSDNRITASIARTLRRPNFNEITPALFEGEFEDNDFQGNPLLKAENAWGLDLGFEHRIGARGVFGVNFFYRDVKDVIETFNTGDISDEYDGYLDDLDDYEDELDDFIALAPPGYTLDDDGFVEYQEDNGVPDDDILERPDFQDPTYVYSVRNTGDGKVWGVEVDLSTPLTFVGLPDTGIFMNYSWLDSEIQDQFGKRRFNNQAEYVFNAGFIHSLPDVGASFGATYRQQGDAFLRVLAEEVKTTYGSDLEVFVEKQFGERFVLRATGSNLLDADKQEHFTIFLNEADQISRTVAESEYEREESGPVFQLVGRLAF